MVDPIKSVIAGNRMAGLATSPASIDRMRCIISGELTIDDAIHEVLENHRHWRHP